MAVAGSEEDPPNTTVNSGTIKVQTVDCKFHGYTPFPSTVATGSEEEPTNAIADAADIQAINCEFHDIHTSFSLRRFLETPHHVPFSTSIPSGNRSLRKAMMRGAPLLC